MMGTGPRLRVRGMTNGGTPPRASRGPGGIDVTSFLLRLTADENGATAIEYALIASGIAVAIVSAVATLGGSVQDNFNLVLDWLTR